eukprot:scaffold5591_cov70-Skeletonema_dohrnii-CCMP3373.AAC.3
MRKAGNVEVRALRLRQAFPWALLEIGEGGDCMHMTHASKPSTYPFYLLLRVESALNRYFLFFCLSLSGNPLSLISPRSRCTFFNATCEGSVSCYST